MNGSRDKSRVSAAVFGLAALLVWLPAHAAGQRNDDETWLRDCDDRGDRNREVFCDVRVQTVPARSLLRVDAGQNGGIRVIGSNRRDFEVHARIQTHAESMDAAERIANQIQLELTGGTMSADGPRVDRRESWSVSFTVYVPNQTNLELEASNGPMSVDNVTGRIQATTTNGPLSLTDVSGNVTARTNNGPLNVSLSGPRWDGSGLDAETRNGPVHLSIPENYSAELETGTVNGPFDTEIPLTVTTFGRVDKRRIESTLGQGGAPIRVVTTNGPVTIRRR